MRLWAETSRGRFLATIVSALVCVALASGGFMPTGAVAVVGTDATTGSIAGRVTDADGTPLPGAVFRIWRYEGTWEDRVILRSGRTGENGEYLISDLAPGTYRIGLGPSSDRLWAAQFYEGSDTLASASDVTIAAGGTVTGIDARLGRAAAIIGGVFDQSGAPLDLRLAEIEIIAHYEGASGWEPLDIRSAPSRMREGDYILEGIPAGVVRVLFRSRMGVFSDTYYDGAETIGAAESLELAEGQTRADIDASLTYAATGPVAEEIAGGSRFDTAVEASKRSFPDGAATVVIATGRNWPDALGGTALAGVVGGPILLTDTNTLPASVRAEIGRLGARKAIILGGPAAVGAAVENALVGIAGAGGVERIAGGSRYETAERVARRVIAERGAAYDGGAFVATGRNFPDALAAAPVAARKGWPLYLAHPERGISSTTRAAMAGVTDVVILGGAAAIPELVETGLVTTYGADRVTRLAGTDRYKTAVKVAEYAVEEAGHIWNRVGVSTGQRFPDALAGGVVQGRAASVMLLVRSESLGDETRAILSANRRYIGTVTFYGGSGAVGPAVRSATARALEY